MSRTNRKEITGARYVTDENGKVYRVYKHKGSLIKKFRRGERKKTHDTLHAITKNTSIGNI